MAQDNTQSGDKTQSLQELTGSGNQQPSSQPGSASSPQKLQALNQTMSTAPVNSTTNHPNGFQQTISGIQNEFDNLTKPEPFGTKHTGNPVADAGITALSNLGAGVMGLATPVVHPVKFAQSLQPGGGGGGTGTKVWETLGGPAAVLLDRTVDPFAKNKGESWSDYAKRAGGQGVTMLPAFAAPEAMEGVGDLAGKLRTAAVGDPEQAFLRGVNVPAKSSEAQGALNDYRTASPALKGVQSLQDLQNRVESARSNIYNPDSPSPDWLNKVLNNPDENFPPPVRQQYEALSNIGDRIDGRTTVGETAQPYGFRRVGSALNPVTFDISRPLGKLGDLTDAGRDILAGRYWSAKPTDAAIRDAFYRPVEAPYNPANDLINKYILKPSGGEPPTAPPKSNNVPPPVRGAGAKPTVETTQPIARPQATPAKQSPPPVTGSSSNPVDNTPVFKDEFGLSSMSKEKQPYTPVTDYPKKPVQHEETYKAPPPTDDEAKGVFKNLADPEWRALGYRLDADSAPNVNRDILANHEKGTQISQAMTKASNQQLVDFANENGGNGRYDVSKMGRTAAQHGKGVSPYKADVINYIITKIDPDKILKNWNIE